MSIKFTRDGEGGHGGSGGTGSSIPQAIASAVASILGRMMNPFKVTLPNNFYNPVGTDSFDIRALDVYAPAEQKVLLSYTAKEGQTIRFIKYGLFTNILKADDVRWYAKINGNRILRYHGDPQQDFALNLSLGPDLTENSLIPCDFDLKTGQTLEIVAVNNSASPADIGARFRGYLVNESQSSRGFGG